MGKTRCATLLAVVTSLFLCPLYWIAQYSFPSADDFTFLSITSEAWKTTQSLGNVLQAVKIGYGEPPARSF